MWVTRSSDGTYNVLTDPPSILATWSYAHTDQTGRSAAHLRMDDSRKATNSAALDCAFRVWSHTLHAPTPSFLRTRRMCQVTDTT